MRVSESTIRSEALGNERTVWIQAPGRARRARGLGVLLDGEYYLEGMDAPAVIRELVDSASIPPLAVAHVSHVDGPTRWDESCCNPLFARFVAEELVPWLRHATGARSRDPGILGGLSLTGLAAAHVALLYPGAFSGVFSQSGSFWWSEGRLVDRFRETGLLPVRFRITCGREETEERVEHTQGDAVLFQRASQRDSNRALRDALLANGNDVSYEETRGGHDLSNWKRDLARSIRAALGIEVPEE